MKPIEQISWSFWRGIAGSVLLVTVAIFVWLAPRGFEYTDESFYLLSLTSWREISSSPTLFGVVLGGPFELLGQSIVVFRLAGMFALLCSSAYMARAALRFAAAGRRSAEPGLDGFVVLVVMGTAMQFYTVFGVLRVPSYNLLALCALMFATGAMLGLSAAQRAGEAYFLRAVIYGVALGLCAAGKVSTALLGSLLHLVYFGLLLRGPRPVAIGKAAIGAVLGFALVAGAVLVLQPKAAAILSMGLSLSRIVDDRYGPASLVNLLRWDVQRQVSEYWFVPVGLLALAAAQRWWPGRIAAWVYRAVFAACLLASVAAQTSSAWSHLWLLLAALGLLWSFAPAERCSSTTDARGRSVEEASLPFLLMSLPLAFSFGTNGRVLAHCEAAAAPAMLGVCLIAMTAYRQGRMGRGGAALCLLLLALPAVVGQWRLIADLSANYRQRVPLGAQQLEVHVGPAGSRLLVDEATSSAIQSLQVAASKAGFKSGTAVQDFTGDGAGIVFILGGRPLAAAWMSGGYPGAEAAASKLLSGVDKQALANAWLISSEDNPRSIPNWHGILEQRLGQGSHELAATVEIRSPYDWVRDSPGTWRVALWRPARPSPR